MLGSQVLRGKLMLIRQGTARDGRTDRQLASYLAAVAGALNAGVFYAVGFFSANMTGNVSALSDNVAIGDWVPALFYLTVVLAFISGSITSTSMAILGYRRGISGIYAYAILLEAILLGALGCTDLFVLTTSRINVLVWGLAFLMGMQNAVVTRLSDARVRTTHISGMATDLGIELAIAADSLLGNRRQADSLENRRKLGLHFQSILSFFIGGVIGVAAYQSIGAYLWLSCAAMLVWLAVRNLIVATR